MNNTGYMLKLALALLLVGCVDQPSISTSTHEPCTLSLSFPDHWFIVQCWADDGKPYECAWFLG